MFQLFKKKTNNAELVAVTDGKSIPMEQVNDPAFSSKALGDGVAVVPENNVIVAPCDGNLSLVADTRHAFGITREDGLEIMVHVGIDTVALNGEGFKTLAEVGTDVKKGQPIIEFDPEVMKAKGIDMTTMLILLNYQDYNIKAIHYGRQVKKGTDVVVEYTK